MISKLTSATVFGLTAYAVEVEVDIAMGLPQFVIVGLPDNAVKESRERVISAIRNSGYGFNFKKITINLAPADTKKEGSAFDLPIAIGLMASSGLIDPARLVEHVIVGELALDGVVRPVKGVLPIAMLAKAMNLSLILPTANTVEAAIVEGLTLLPVATLTDVIKHLQGEIDISAARIDIDEYMSHAFDYPVDFHDIKGQESAKRAIEVAAAGGHNILMIGPPGSGKTMLAKRVPTILSAMNFDEALETTKVYSVSGLLDLDRPLMMLRPFRNPHHTVSDVGLIGGGTYPRPGEVSLAHNGVLFLDELPEFKKSTIEVLRQPLENRSVTITRASGTITYPSSMMLVAAMNPCPCGYYGDRTHECTCTAGEVHKYRSRVSGPLLDRIDIHIEVPALRYKEMSETARGESSSDIRERITRARATQVERFAGMKIYCNAQMNSRELEKYCRLDADSIRLLEQAVDRMGLSARAYSRVLKVARTIADLEGVDAIRPPHIAEAIGYRSLDRSNV